MDVSRSEQVETDLDRLMWAESVRRYNVRQEENHRLAWCEHYRHMRAVHYGLGDEYDQKLRQLENGHAKNGHENGTKGDPA